MNWPSDRKSKIKKHIFVCVCMCHLSENEIKFLLRTLCEKQKARKAKRVMVVAGDNKHACYWEEGERSKIYSFQYVKKEERKYLSNILLRLQVYSLTDWPLWVLWICVIFRVCQCHNMTRNQRLEKCFSIFGWRCYFFLIIEGLFSYGGDLFDGILFFAIFLKAISIIKVIYNLTIFFSFHSIINHMHKNEKRRTESLKNWWKISICAICRWQIFFIITQDFHSFLNE